MCTNSSKKQIGMIETCVRIEKELVKFFTCVYLNQLYLKRIQIIESNETMAKEQVNECEKQSLLTVIKPRGKIFFIVAKLQKLRFSNIKFDAPAI